MLLVEGGCRQTCSRLLKAHAECALLACRLQRELVTLFLGIGQQDLQLLCVSAPSRLELLLGAAQHVCSEEELKGIQQLAAMLQ